MKKQYDLNDAIKCLYKIEPLKIDLAATVTNKVYTTRKKDFALMDKCLHLLVIILVVSGVIYCLSLFKQLPLLEMFLFTVAIVCFLSLSYKEYAVMSKKFLSAVVE